MFSDLTFSKTILIQIQSIFANCLIPSEDDVSFPQEGGEGLRADIHSLEQIPREVSPSWTLVTTYRAFFNCSSPEIQFLGEEQLNHPDPVQEDN